MIRQECIDEMAAEAGVGDRVAAITARAMNGEIDFEGCAARAGGAAGRARRRGDRPDVIERRIDLYARRRGAGGDDAGAMAGGRCWSPAGSLRSPIGRRRAAGLRYAHRANVLETSVDGRLTGTVPAPPILGRDGEGGGRWMRRGGRRSGLAAADVQSRWAMGRTISTCSAAAGMGVALHAKPAVQAHRADLVVDHGDLTAVLYLQGYRDAEIAAAIVTAGVCRSDRRARDLRLSPPPGGQSAESPNGAAAKGSSATVVPLPPRRRPAPSPPSLAPKRLQDARVGVHEPEMRDALRPGRSPACRSGRATAWRATAPRSTSQAGSRSRRCRATRGIRSRRQPAMSGTRTWPLRCSSGSAEDDPAAGAAHALPERPPNFGDQAGMRVGVARRGAWLKDQRAVDQLRHHARRRGQHVVVGRGALGDVVEPGHGTSLVRADPPGKRPYIGGQSAESPNGAAAKGSSATSSAPSATPTNTQPASLRRNASRMRASGSTNQRCATPWAR